MFCLRSWFRGPSIRSVSAGDVIGTLISDRRLRLGNPHIGRKSGMKVLPGADNFIYIFGGLQTDSRQGPSPSGLSVRLSDGFQRLGQRAGLAIRSAQLRSEAVAFPLHSVWVLILSVGVCGRRAVSQVRRVRPQLRASRVSRRKAWRRSEPGIASYEVGGNAILQAKYDG